MEIDQELLTQLETHGQQHLLQYWDVLADAEQQSLQQQLEAIDFALVEELIRYREASQGSESGDSRAQVAKSPEQLVRLPQSEMDRITSEQAAQLGEELLRQGKVGAILVAGGQGSRLGFDLPKGMFPIGPVSERTLFQVLCEQLLARAKQAGTVIPYFIMTSEATHPPTIEFFQQNDYFGLGEENVYFFQQGAFPAVDDSSTKILLEEKGRVATSPDGHGGMLRALGKYQLLDVMRQRGIEHLFYHQVDNPTAKVCDPTLIGLHAQHQSDLTTKVVAKVSPEEKMGVLVSINGKTEIIEYSDLSPEDAHRTDENGQYIFWAGNTAIHVFRREFLESLLADASSLPFHIAHKKVPYVNASGEKVEPESPNANKFEQFIFDALPHAKTALVVEGDRQREFNPVKNAEGNDSPATSKLALNRIAREWIEAAGGSVDADAQIEISPLYALDEHQLAQKISSNMVISHDTILSE